MVEYPSITSSMNQSALGLREGMDRIPHIVIGKKEEPKPKHLKKKVRKEPRDFKPKLYVPPTVPKDTVDKLRRFILYFLTGLVVAVVVILVIVNLFKRFF